MLAGKGNRVARRPQRSNNLDGLFECLDTLARGTCRPTQAVDALGECSGTEAEFEPAAGEQVEGRGAAGEYRRWPQRQIRHVREERDVLGLRGEGREEGPGVEEVRLVRVVLHAEDVEA